MDSLRERAAHGHLRLAEGLIKTARIGDSASEYEIRNAFSRVYYALFHACRAFLWARADVNVDALGKKHGRLHAEMERQLGKFFGQDLRSSYELRRRCDYEPDWGSQPGYWQIRALKDARGQCYFVIRTAQRLLSQQVLR